MKIGTTPTHEYTLPLSVDTYTEIRVVYSQDNSIVLSLSKEKASSIDGKTISFKLTEAQSFMFVPDKMVEIQVRVKTADGTVDASDIISITAQRCLDSEVI